MNEIVRRIKQYATAKPDSIAYKVYDVADNAMLSDDGLSWKDLDVYSDNLCYYIINHVKSDTPIVVYGHKNKFMLVCFIACVKSGHAYVPVDISVPSTRFQDIIESVNPEIILATVNTGMESYVNANRLLLLNDITQICNNVITMDANASGLVEYYLKPQDVFYIIFTSGSTGKPKGVQITTECLVNYVNWASHIGGQNYCEHEFRFLNQAPFSFDLSVMDVYISLFTGGTICAITKNIQSNLKLLYQALSLADINVWVSTPSFADVCLSDKCFNNELVPHLRSFLFCGEILTNRTVERLMDNFPETTIVNTYGPTESTVCITEVVINKELLSKYNPLPVGAARCGTWLFIVDETGKILPEGEQGEIIIVGDTVSIGYFKNEEQTQRVFSTMKIDGVQYRLYHTGDKGYLKNGQLFYNGRIDFQIKLHGYRIEIEDIESNLVKVDGVEKAVVIPNMEDNKVKSLTAYVVYSKEHTSDFQTAQAIRNSLKSYIPEYMIPKKIKFVETIPMTMNGKADRRALEGYQQ